MVNKYEDLEDFTTGTNLTFGELEPEPKPTWRERFKRFWDGAIAVCVLIGVMGGFMYALDLYAGFIKEVINAL